MTQCSFLWVVGRCPSNFCKSKRQPKKKKKTHSPHLLHILWSLPRGPLGQYRQSPLLLHLCTSRSRSNSSRNSSSRWKYRSTPWGPKHREEWNECQYECPIFKATIPTPAPCRRKKNFHIDTRFNNFWERNTQLLHNHSIFSCIQSLNFHLWACKLVKIHQLSP